MKKIIISLSVGFVLCVLFTQTASALTCTNLQSDFGLSTRSSDVLALQKFLASSDYLSATPNGYFGQGTLSALKKFQSVNGLSSTGYAGPLTRALIQKQSCVVEVTTKPTPVVSAPTANTQTTTSQPVIVFTSPKSGNVLQLGKTTSITWSGTPSSDFALVLENESGVAQGFISAFPVQGQISWEVGSVNASGNDLSTFVAPGNYRVRFQSKSKGASQTDVKSEVFQLIAPELNVKSVIPATIPSDNKSVAVLYGSGFFGKTNLRLGDMYNQTATVLFSSTDGRVIVFSIPSGISPGIYPLLLNNKYGSTPVSPVMITVTSP